MDKTYEEFLADGLDLSPLGFERGAVEAYFCTPRGAEIAGREGVDGKLWERVKKGVYGNKVRGLNSFENLCVGQAQAFFAGYDYLDFAALFASVAKEEAEELIASLVTGERTALSVVRPKEG